MNANASVVPYKKGVYLALFLSGLAMGCHQPHYQTPYQTMPYGQPQPYYGQPQPYGQPMQMSPGISSVPADSFYTPSPGGGASPTPAAPGDAPVFQNPSTQAPPNNPGNGQSVPKYNDPTSGSPYFESRLSPESKGAAVDQFAQAEPVETPQEQRQMAHSTTNVAPAGFDQANPFGTPSPDEIDLTSEEQLAQFEPPVTVSKPTGRTFEPEAEPELPTRPAPLAGQSQGMFGAFEPEPSPAEPSVAESTAPAQTAANEPQPVTSPFELAAPPTDAEKTAAGNALEGTVRYRPEADAWHLEFGPPGNPNDPFGGKLQLTGSKETMKSLKDGRHYRLRGFIETGDGATMQNRFYIQHIENLGSPFSR